MSSKSRRFRAGSITRVRPAAAAATTFSLMPPTGSTRPRSEISPVMAVSLRTVRSVSSEASAVNIATPALGPSFGVAPAGTWTWMSLFSNIEGVDAELSGAALDQGQRRLRALAHHVAELAGQDQRALSGRAGGLDEEDVAADRRPGEPGRDAGHAGAHRDLVFEAGLAEHRGEILRGDDDPVGAAFGDLDRGIAQCLADFALQIANAGLAGIAADDQPERFGSISACSAVSPLASSWRRTR